MEQEHHHHQLMIVHDDYEEEVEDVALKRTLPHNKDNNLVTSVVVSSSSSSSPASSNAGGHGNGIFCTVVTDPDGFPLQKEEGVAEIGNVGEKSIHFDGDKEDCEAVGLGLVAEFVEAAINGEAMTGGATFGAHVSQNKNKNSVYFDTQQDHEVNGLDRVQNGDAARSVGPTNPEESEFEVQVENSVVRNSLCSEVNNQCMKTVDDKVPSSSELSPLHDSSDIQATTVVNLHEETNSKEGPNLTQEIDQQTEEFDVEVVLAKQETHDLFCPNCKSCITKRVILKKRKRNVQNLDNKAKRDKFDTVDSSNLVNGSAHEANQGDHANVTSDITTSLEPPADNDHPEREPEVFRCLSCLSFFIPSGKGFNLFRNFGGASKPETSQSPSSTTAPNLQNPSNLPGSNPNWLISLFTSKRGKTATEQGDTSLEHSRTGPAEQHHSTSINSNMPTSTEIGHPEGPLADTAIIENVKPIPDIDHGRGMLNSLISSNGVQSVGQDFIDFSAKEQSLTGEPRTNEGEKKNASVDTTKTSTTTTTTTTTTTKTNNVGVMPSVSFSNDTVSKYESVQSVTAATNETLVDSGETAKDGILNPGKGEPVFLVPTTVGSPTLEKSQKDVEKTPEIVNNDSSLSQGAQSPVQSSDSTIIAIDVASNEQSSGIDAIFPSKPDLTLIEKARQDIIEEINPSARKENKGDVIVTVERETYESTTFQTADNVPVVGATMTGSQTRVSTGEQPRDEIVEPQRWEILKSIVYGGLVESITSLGIVSSAASSGATPLNIIALGFANLIGGLFILGHNLNDLKNDNSRGEQQPQTNAQDRYQELLGRRANFVFHAVVAILSFLIFGSVPLIIYGVLINKNYYDEVKLAIVAATPVACIILLAIGKAYTRRPPKFYTKTVLYYVTMALATSGLSCIAGNLIKDLLEKFSHSESGFATTMPITDTSVEPAWMSY